jgi:hypothetical protein
LNNWVLSPLSSSLVFPSNLKWLIFLYLK